jgi:hypothetical protein
MLWLAGPVAIPLARYQAPLLQNNERLIAAQNALFSSEQEMANANPQMILERAPQISLPSLLVHQGTKDDDVPPNIAILAAGRRCERLSYIRL